MVDNIRLPIYFRSFVSDKAIKAQRVIFINYAVILEQHVPCNVCITKELEVKMIFFYIK